MHGVRWYFPPNIAGGITHSSAKRPNHCCHGEAVNISIHFCETRQEKEAERRTLSPMTRSSEPHANTLMRVGSTNTLGSVNVRPTLPSSAAPCPYCGGSGFALMAVQAGPQHSSVLGRESQHVFIKVFCIKVKVIFNFRKMSGCLEGK